MSCDQARELLGAYVDSELDVAHGLEVEEHLESCHACARIVQNHQRLHTAIQSSGLAYEPSAALEQRIDRALGVAARSGQRSPARWPWMAVAAAVLLAIAIAGRMQIGRAPASETLLAQEVLDSHLRSLMPGHLTDVESTDRHTVKPWFSGKLDFSPPVEDFAADGFPLTGGRMDSISGRTVAALVYKRNQHAINLYLWPSSAPPSTPAAATLQGYNLLHWTGAGFAWWIVSDLNAEELRQLAERLRGGAH